MIIIHIIKLTDNNIYLYNKKKKKLITEPISSNIIKDCKIYNVKKIIKTLEEVIKRNKMNDGILKTNLKILINETITPAEKFTLEHVLSRLINVKYELISEESLINDKDILIMWSDNIYYQKSKANINEVKKSTFSIKKEIILVGMSDNFEKNKEILERVFKINIFEYENSDTILFERA